MKYHALIGVGALCALSSLALANDAGHLASYVKKLYSAEGLDVTYSINVVGGSKSEFHVVLSKPDKALIVTPTRTFYADGTNITAFNKSRNTYFVQEQTDVALKGLLSDEELSLWRGFFDPLAFDDVVSTQDEGTRNRRGEELKIVSAQLDSVGEQTIKLYVSQQDGLLRQAQFLEKSAARESTSILTVDTIRTSKPTDGVFAFEPPTGAVLLTVFDLRAEFIAELVSFATTAMTSTTGLNYKPVQPENQVIADKYYAALIEEFSKYPTEFIKKSNLKRIVLVEKLAEGSTFMAARPITNAETLYYDVTYFTSELYARYVIHHEFYHMIEEEWNGSAFYKDPNWAAFNEKGFSYGDGGRSAYNQREDVWSFVHPMKGFVNWYSSYGLEEDKAVVWGGMFTPELWKLVKTMIRTDSIIGAKVDYLRKFGESYSAEMDEEFWNSLSGDGG